MPASQAYTEALGIERESADEWEVRRVEKSTKKAKTKGAREELDKILGIHRSKRVEKIVDEINMVDIFHLYLINRHCNSGQHGHVYETSHGPTRGLPLYELQFIIQYLRTLSRKHLTDNPL
jgi:hypothetical protein